MGLLIVGLGDSTTAGTPGFLSPLEAPPEGRGNPESQYAYWMMCLHPGWRVLNRGIDGQRTDEILARFRRDVTQAKPDYVIVLAGVNDIFQGFQLNGVKMNLRTIYENAISDGIKTVAASILSYNTATESEANAIRELNVWIATTAQELGILFCDTNKAVVDPNDPNRLRASPDGYHPDVTGYRSMGESLAATIAAALRLERSV
jgi:lysophospholipase L1-like esterase